MPFSTFQQFSIAPAMLALATLAAQPSAAERWTSLDGSSTVEARMIGMWADNVVLELDGGRRVTVKLGDLRAESRIQARDLAEVQTQTRSGLVQELKAQAEEAAAPAPTPIPKPPAAPAYVQPKPDATVIEQLTLVDEQSRAGHIVAAFDSLPPSYQKDISDLAKLGAAKINVDSWQSLIGSIHSIGEVIVTRQRWVFSHPRLETMTPATLEPMQEIILLVAGLIRDGLDPKALDPKRLQSMPLRDWIMERDQVMAPYLAALYEYGGGMSQQSFELVSEKDGVATIKASAGELSVTLPYSKVEGFWVPKDLADQWPELMAQAREKLEATADGTLLTDPMTTMIPGMIQPVIGPMTGATDKKGFHAAMETLFAQAAPIANLAGMDLSGRRRRGSSEYGDYGEEGYGEDYDMEMMEEYDQQMEEDYNTQMEESSGSTPNPNIGARFEEEMRRRRTGG